MKIVTEVVISKEHIGSLTDQQLTTLSQWVTNEVVERFNAANASDSVITCTHPKDHSGIPLLIRKPTR